MLTLLLSLSLAAPGDLGYRTRTEVEVSPVNAGNLAQAFKDVAAWDGLNSDMTRCVVEVHDSEVTGFRAWCMGDKPASAVLLPLGSLTTGRRGPNILYEDTVFVAVTVNEARALADNFIALGGWSGTRNRMTKCTLERHQQSTTGFRAVCAGTVAVHPDSVPDGVVVTDRE
jgi:hypothetical protein